jgi:pimeloyl-ACP methyl ester carboxylesterase
MPANLGFTTHGNGPLRVLVLHDWFCDHSGWDAALPYLTPDRFTYVFADLRGYGASREIEGACTLDEAAADAIALANKLGWTRFSLIGHSMSGLIVQRIPQLVPDRIARIVAITPVPPAGLSLDPPAVDYFRSIALAGDEERFSAVGPMWGARLSETWIGYKLRRWRETAAPEAVAKYVELWGCGDVSPGAREMKTPMLIVAGDQDAPPFQPGALQSSMLPYYPNAKMIALAESGHYPMQEQPPLLATVIERFLGE